ncbi:MAG: peptidase S10 [Oligoflexia bacterium]|nr:peptidase S10 [Oligoflexia bacterium]
MSTASPDDPRKDTDGDSDSDSDSSVKHKTRKERSISAPGTTVIGGRTLAFTTTAATVNIQGEDGKDRASLFTISHVLDGDPDPATRPVTFCFNGGPGSSSVWLHYGALGPRRVLIPDTLPAPPPPYPVQDNPHSLLDLTDLVFIDPVGTGLSRPQGDAKAADFHNIDGDIESVGELIRRWLDTHGRWASPKLLAGESYGTTRAAGLAGWLNDKGIILNGLVLISLATDFQNFVFEQGNDLPHILYLPAYTATAWYHGRLPDKVADLDSLLAEVREFAIAEYAPALLLGSRLDSARRDELAVRLARYTGLPAAQIARRRLRIEYGWFMRTLLGQGEQTVGRLDSRFVGPDLDPYGQEMTRDPSYDAALGAFTAAANDHLRRSLGWEDTEPYNILSMKVNQAWKWDRGERMGFPSTSADLRRALIANPHLRVLICNGLFDLATPAMAAQYTVDHLNLPATLTDNVRLALYQAGHMMYFHPPSLKKLKADLARLFAEAVPART